MKTKFLAVALAGLFALGAIFQVDAQTRPTQNPTYIPTGQMAAQTLSTPTSSSSYVIQGEGTLAILVTGTHPGLVARIEGSNNPAAVADGSATWTTLQGVTANGLYRVPVSGLTRVRFTVSAITSGSAVVTMAGAPGPYTAGNQQLGNVMTSATGYSAGTYNSTQFINHDGKGVTCTYVQTAESGSPSTTFSIDAYDAASNSYRALITSPTVDIVAPFNPEYTLTVYPGIQTTSLPSYSSAINLHLPRAFRVTHTVGGSSTPGITGTLGCTVLQ